MDIAIVAPSPVPFLIGGAEKLWWGMLRELNQRGSVRAELIKLPSPEADFFSLMDSYRSFSALDLHHFDAVISTKYPAFMVNHPRHVCYLQHRLRGLYDTYHLTGLPIEPDLAHPGVRELAALLDRAPDRAILGEVFSRLDELRGEDLPPETFAFPGPLTRRIVHGLDAIGCQTTAIEKFCAISRNVAGREAYFPAGASVEVIHHPSDLTDFRDDGHDYVFTVSRLEGAKRVELLIDAFMQTEADIEFRIAGTGPDLESLQSRAADDPRIRFLGRLTDADIVSAYASALFVPFVPYDEDYGLVTIEAMMSGKAVLTTHDAGGVNEFVVQGATGLSVPPTVPALADAMQQLIDDREQTIAMGRKAQAKVRNVTWSNTIDRLMPASTPPASTRGATASVSRLRALPRLSSRGAAGRRKLVVALGFPVWPPYGGGKSRVFHFWSRLARHADVVIVSLCSAEQASGRFSLAAGIVEERIARTEAHLVHEGDVDRAVGIADEDIALIEGTFETPAYGEALARHAASADAIILSHPFLHDAVRAVWAGPIWYEAHNVEADMKAAALGETDQAARYLEQVRRVEAACWTTSELIMTCSVGEIDRFEQLYGPTQGRVEVVPNGVDLSRARYVDAAERHRLKSVLGTASRFQALFMGSWHGPNIEAIERLVRIANEHPRIEFLVMGSVCDHPVCADLPDNIRCLGLVSSAEKQVLLGAVDVALNPIVSGSGTNLKMLDYAAAGVPILTTPFGNRGLDFESGVDVLVAGIDDFGDVLARLAAGEFDPGSLAEGAHRRVAEAFDWQVIADGFAAAMNEVLTDRSEEPPAVLTR